MRFQLTDKLLKSNTAPNSERNLIKANSERSLTKLSERLTSARKFKSLHNVDSDKSFYLDDSLFYGSSKASSMSTSSSGIRSAPTTPPESPKRSSMSKGKRHLINGILLDVVPTPFTTSTTPEDTEDDDELLFGGERLAMSQTLPMRRHRRSLSMINVRERPYV